MLKSMRRAAVLLPFLASTFAASAAALDAPEAVASEGAASASVLLAVDQNRATIVDRIVNDWGDKLVAAGAGVDRTQLKAMLFAMRADQLLAASLAGSLDGLKSILVSSSAMSKARIAAAGDPVPNALGSTTSDLVYTPVTPCRLFDTRPSQGGIGTPALNVRRTYGAITPVASQGNVAGCAASANATVALMVIGTLTPSAPGVLQGGPQGAASFPNALILYQPGDQYGTSVAIPLNPANGRFDLLELFGQADLYGDLLGYFAPPAATALDCVESSQTTGTGTVAVGSTATVNAPSCPAGYSATGLSCFYSGNAPIGFQVTEIAIGFYCVFQNTSASNVSGSALWARTRCCRVPGH